MDDLYLGVLRFLYTVSFFIGVFGIEDLFTSSKEVMKRDLEVRVNKMDSRFVAVIVGYVTNKNRRS